MLIINYFCCFCIYPSQCRLHLWIKN